MVVSGETHTVELTYAGQNISVTCLLYTSAVKVKECVAVPKSKKLLQFTLDDGTGTDRTILSGIHAVSYTHLRGIPEDFKCSGRSRTRTENTRPSDQ